MSVTINHRWLLTIASLVALLWRPSGLANDEDVPQLPEVPSLYAQVARFYGLPPVLFYAVALQESSRNMERFGGRRPWPWTLNVEGEGHYYETKTEVWDALTEFLRRGKRSIDIGLLQVNWRYNKHILKDPYAVLEPHANIRAAAVILRYRYDESGDWWVAVGRYHSPGQSTAQLARAERYQESVKRHWRRLYGPQLAEFLSMSD